MRHPRKSRPSSIWVMRVFSGDRRKPMPDRTSAISPRKVPACSLVPEIVSIQPILAALWSLALCDCCWAWSGDFRGGWHPRVSGEGVTYRGKGVRAVLGGGGGVAPDGVAVAGGGLGTEAAGNLLLGLRRAQVAFGLVGCGRDPQVGQEPEHVGLAIAQAFKEEPAWLLPRLRSGDPPDLLQADENG